MVDAVGIEKRGTAFDAVHDIAFLQQKLGKIRAVLACDARDERDFGLGCLHDGEIVICF